MQEVGLREMRQSASDLVRRAAAGEQIMITVAGRPAASLGPVSPRTWRRWDDVAAIFALPADEDWSHDRDRLDGSPGDPWPDG